MTLSFRTRLTLRWLAAFGLILTLTNVVIYVGTRAFLLRELDAQLRTLAATELASAVDEPTDGIHLHEFAIDPRPGEEYADKFVQLVDRQGAVLLQSPRLGSSPSLLTSEAFSDALSGRAPVVDVVALGRQGRMIGLATRGREPYVVAVGLYTDQIDGRLARLRTLLVLVWIGGLAVTAVVGLSIASRALQPIQRITQKAAAIAEGQFAERLDPPEIDDEIGRMTRLLNQMLERLHGAITANQRFAADASHELRSPLTAMQGEIELALKRDRSPEEYRQALTVLGERLRVMNALTDDLMLLVRTQEHTPPPTREVRLAPLLHRVAERTAGIAAQVGVQINVDVPQGFIVYGEEALLERVFDNLMRNAVQYNHPQGVVRITASLQPAQGQWVSDEVLVTVANTGASVPEAERERVFERFYRLDPSRSRLTGGSGLGLAISREIVRLFKGTIRVGDQIPGTTIEVRLKGSQHGPF